MVQFFNEQSFLIAQIFGFIAMGLAILTYQFRSRRMIMFLLTATSFVWCAHFIVLGKYAGFAMNAVTVLRTLVFAYKGDKKWASAKAVPWIFGAVSFAVCIFTWEGAASLLPLIGTVASTAANWQTDTKRLKKLTIPVSGAWFVYDLLGKSIAGCLNEIFVLCSIAVFFIRAKKQKTVQ